MLSSRHPETSESGPIVCEGRSAAILPVATAGFGRTPMALPHRLGSSGAPTGSKVRFFHVLSIPAHLVRLYSGICSLLTLASCLTVP